MTSRRQFLVAGALGALGALGVPYAAAQVRQPRIGILSALPLDKSLSAPLLLKSLSEFGYRDGAGMVLEFRSSNGIDARYPELARDLIARGCDVIFALPAEAIARVFRDARTSVPVVFIALEYDPLERGIVDSLSRPTGNMTGVYAPTGALRAKQLEIAQEILPGASRFLVLTDESSRNQLAALKKAADTRRAQLIVVEYAQAPYDLTAGVETGRRAGVHAVIGMQSAEFAARRAELAALFASYRLPAFVPGFMATEPGILASYAVDSVKLHRRAVEIGVRILKGAKPVDIPVEQLDEFDLVVNLKTAKALGVKIPYSVLTRATRVIE
jgi:putative ABC transport system substrate-binding protein